MSVRIIAFIAVFAALALAREIFIPIALALCFYTLLKPLVAGLANLRIPTPAGAAVVVLGILALFVAGGWALSDPVSQFVNDAPESIAQAREKLSTMGGPMRRISEAARGTEADSAGGRRADPPPAAPPPPARPPVSLLGLMGGAWAVIVGFTEVLILVFLLLAAGDLLLSKLVKVLPGPDEKRTARDVAQQTRSIVARYLLVTAAINAVEGIVVALVMWALGMPNPLVWGLLTFALEFIPYIGAAIIIGLLLMTSFTIYSGLGQVVLPPLLYLAITTIQNNVVSPYAYGGRLKLNPLAVVVFVMLFWFIWGVPGAFLSIPIAATLKVLGDQVPSLAPLGAVLGD